MYNPSPNTHAQGAPITFSTLPLHDGKGQTPQAELYTFLHRRPGPYPSHLIPAQTNTDPDSTSKPNRMLLQPLPLALRALAPEWGVAAREPAQRGHAGAVAGGEVGGVGEPLARAAVLVVVGVWVAGEFPLEVHDLGVAGHEVEERARGHLGGQRLGVHEGQVEEGAVEHAAARVGLVRKDRLDGVVEAAVDGGGGDFQGLGVAGPGEGWVGAGAAGPVDVARELVEE